MSAPPVLGPADLPDLRLWLREQWKPGAVFDGVVGRHARRHDTFDRGWYSRWEHDTLGRAGLWYVAADMVDLLAAAMPGVPDDVRFEDLPRPDHAGLVVLEKPLAGIDAETGERTIQLDGFTWGGANLPAIARPGSSNGIPCVSVSSYRRLDFDEGLSSHDLQLAVKTKATRHATTTELPAPTVNGRPATAADQVPMDEASRSIGFSGHDADGNFVRNVALHGQSWAPLGRSDWPMDELLGEWTLVSPHSGLYTDTMKASAQEDRRLLAALWTFLAQEGMATTTTHVVPRQVRRRSERAGVPDSRHVQVVTLRRLHRTRPEGEPDDHHEHYSHRFPVAGHWRNAAVGHGRTERRLTWVRPHIKGPEGTPLVVKERVNAWVR